MMWTDREVAGAKPGCVSDRLARRTGVTARSLLVLAGIGAAPALAQTGGTVSTPAETTRPSASASASASTQSRFSRGAEAEIAFQEGLLRYSRGELAQAEQNFRTVAGADPTDAEAFYYLGLTQLDRGNPQPAVESFNRSLLLDYTRDEVRAARSTAHVRLRKFDDAEADLAVLDRDPKWRSLVAYNRGQLLYAKGDLEGAGKQFAAAKSAGSTEAAPAEFYEGLTYLRMRNLVQARTTFHEASVGVDRDPTVAAASRQLDAVLASQQRANKPYEGQITLAYEYDTNVVQIGSDAINTTTISGQAANRVVVQPRGSYSLWHKDKLELGVEGAGYFSFHDHGLSDFDIASLQAGPYANWQFTKNLYGSFRYGFNYLLLDRDPYLVRHMFTPQVTLIEPKFGYTSAFYQFQVRQFDDEPADRRLDQDGTSHSLGVVQGITLPTLFKDAGPANLELNYRLERQETSGSDFDGVFNSVGATVYSPLPFWKLRADAGVSFDYEHYDHGNSADANNDPRRDYAVNVVAGLTRELTKNLAVRVDYTYTHNFSNVETAAGVNPFDYDRQQVGARLIYSF